MLLRHLGLEIFTFIFALLLPIFSAYSQIQSVELKNLNTTLRNYRGEIRFGEASADLGDAYFEYKEGIIDVEKREDKLHFFLNGAHLTLLKLKEKSLEIIRNSDLKDLQFSWHDQRSLKAEIEELGYASSKGMERIKNVNVRCHSKKTRHKGIENFFVPCFKSGKLTVPKLEIEQTNSIPQSILNDPFIYRQFVKNYGRPMDKSTRTNVNLEDIRVTISNYDWKLRAKADTVFDVKVKGKGDIQYKESKRLIKIHIKKFKAGFLDIKDKILGAIEDMDTENISVKGETIYVDLSLE